MSNFKTLNLQDLAAPGRSVISGPFGSSIGKRFFQPSGIPVIRGNNLTTDSIKFKDQGFVFLSQEKADELKADAIKMDILFTAAGTIGQVGMIPKSSKFERYVISNKQLRFRVDEQKADPEYVYYWLASPWIKKTIENRNTGSTVPLINLGIIKSLPISLPENIQEQQKISRLLSSIDNKIELNNKINTELEAMAKLIYDYWFVQFDFPDANGKPYKSSGGKMVYNEELRREIPEGWDYVPVEYYADIIDPHPSHRAPIKVKEGFPFAGIGDIDKEGNINLTKARVINEDFVLKQEKDYKITDFSLGYGRVGTVGKVVKLRKQSFRYALSPTMAVINPKDEVHAGYIYQSIKDPFFYKLALKNTTGTTRPAIGIQLLRKIPVLKPCEKHSAIFEQFELITKQFLKKTGVLNKQNQQLIKLRDWLLPMLMNGQVSVK